MSLGEGLNEVDEAYEVAGLKVLGMVGEDVYGQAPDLDDIAQWQDTLDLTYDVVGDVDGAVHPVWNPLGVHPRVYLIDAEGVIQFVTGIGPDGNDGVQDAIDQLMEP